jgi:succinylglutamate desuccinylase
MRPPPRPGLPRFPVDLAKPDLDRWLGGNTTVPGFWSFTAPAPGPHVMLVSLVHGNEIAGGTALARLLEDGVRPLRGRLSLGFANLDAFASFDPHDPVASRCIDEDMNRIWCRAVLDGPRESAELRRARAIRPLVDTADILLDLHSMLWQGDPLLLCGTTEKARRLARAIGAPGLVVTDEGHAAGRRLIDYRPFADPGGPRTAVLIEAGHHWQQDTVEIMVDAVARLLRLSDMIDAATAARLCPAPPPPGPPRLAQVTRTVTAATDSFAFVRDYSSGEVIEARNTLVALDGETEVRTPHDQCLLVMPSLSTQKGQTAVRMAKLVDA